MASREVRIQETYTDTTREYSPRIERIDRAFDDARSVLRNAQREVRSAIIDAADAMYACFTRGGKVLVCGNGGSAADAQHFAAEFVGRFKAQDRQALPALALTADTAVLTAWSNDVGYDDVFARQVEAFGRPGDLLVGISTSGNSQNLVEAFEMAHRSDIECVAVLGSGGGELLSYADLSIVVPSSDTQRVQEVQMLILHLLCELVEEEVMHERRQQSTAASPRGNGVEVLRRATELRTNGRT